MADRQDKSGEGRREERGRGGGSRIVAVLQTYLMEHSCNHSTGNTET